MMYVRNVHFLFFSFLWSFIIPFLLPSSLVYLYWYQACVPLLLLFCIFMADRRYSLFLFIPIAALFSVLISNSYGSTPILVGLFVIGLALAMFFCSYPPSKNYIFSFCVGLAILSVTALYPYFSFSSVDSGSLFFISSANYIPLVVGSLGLISLSSWQCVINPNHLSSSSADAPYSLFSFIFLLLVLLSSFFTSTRVTIVYSIPFLFLLLSKLPVIKGRKYIFVGIVILFLSCLYLLYLNFSDQIQEFFVYGDIPLVDGLFSELNSSSERGSLLVAMVNRSLETFFFCVDCSTKVPFVYSSFGRILFSAGPIIFLLLLIFYGLLISTLFRFVVLKRRPLHPSTSFLALSVFSSMIVASLQSDFSSLLCLGFVSGYLFVHLLRPSSLRI